MNCKIIEDLLPLYADDCCSSESREAVEAHLRTCSACARALDTMRAAPVMEEVRPVKLRRVREWKASILQSLMLLCSFALITLGVSLEAATGVGQKNGFWALVLIIPATGWLMSLVNWYFVRSYRGARAFCLSSAAVTALFIVAACNWALLHYGFGFGALIRALAPAVLAVAVSLAASALYARMIGKE